MSGTENPGKVLDALKAGKTPSSHNALDALRVSAAPSRTNPYAVLAAPSATATPREASSNRYSVLAGGAKPGNPLDALRTGGARTNPLDALCGSGAPEHTENPLLQPTGNPLLQATENPLLRTGKKAVSVASGPLGAIDAVLGALERAVEGTLAGMSRSGGNVLGALGHGTNRESIKTGLPCFKTRRGNGHRQAGLRASNSLVKGDDSRHDLKRTRLHARELRLQRSLGSRLYDVRPQAWAPIFHSPCSLENVYARVPVRTAV